MGMANHKNQIRSSGVLTWEGLPMAHCIGDVETRNYIVQTTQTHISTMEMTFFWKLRKLEKYTLSLCFIHPKWGKSATSTAPSVKSTFQWISVIKKWNETWSFFWKVSSTGKQGRGRVGALPHMCSPNKPHSPKTSMMRHFTDWLVRWRIWPKPLLNRGKICLIFPAFPRAWKSANYQLLAINLNLLKHNCLVWKTAEYTWVVYSAFFLTI